MSVIKIKKKTNILPGRQIEYENQIIGKDAIIDLTVVSLHFNENNSQTFNYNFSAFPGRNSLVKLQNREIKTINLQLIKDEKYHQLTIQLNFVEPLNYSKSDLIYRIKTESNGKTVRLVSGFKWLTPESHLSDEAVEEVLKQILGIKDFR